VSQLPFNHIGATASNLRKILYFILKINIPLAESNENQRVVTRIEGANQTFNIWYGKEEQNNCLQPSFDI
jgi:hypothetical protein